MVPCWCPQNTRSRFILRTQKGTTVLTTWFWWVDVPQHPQTSQSIPKPRLQLQRMETLNFTEAARPLREARGCSPLAACAFIAAHHDLLGMTTSREGQSPKRQDIQSPAKGPEVETLEVFQFFHVCFRVSLERFEVDDVFLGYLDPYDQSSGEIHWDENCRGLQPTWDRPVWLHRYNCAANGSFMLFELPLPKPRKDIY